MAQTQAEADPPGRLAYKWKVLISVIFGIFMIILDTTVVNVAFQTIRREYGASLSDAQWIISVYVLALGITTPISGFLADRFGIKNVYIGGLALFVIGSLCCGIAPSLPLLIVARALQGVGGGLAQPLGPALLYRTFPPQEQGQALGFFGIALVVAPALGPILGGYLVDAGLWRWIFFINLPIGALGVFLSSRWLKKDQPGRVPQADPLGIGLAVVAFGSLLYAATIAGDQGWTAASTLTWFAIGLVALVVFGIVELFFAKEPLLDLRLFKSRNFTIATLIGYVTVLALFGAEFLMPVYLQALRGRTALETGVILLSLAIASGIASPIAGRLFDKFGPRPLIVSGFLILAVNTWELARIQADTSIGWIAFLLALRGLALGLTIQTTFATALNSVPFPQLARGSSLINSTRFVVQAVGVAVLSTVLAASLSPEVKAFGAASQEQAGQSTVAQRFGLCETPGVAADKNVPPALATAPAAAQQQALAGVQAACGEYVKGFEQTYQLTFYFAVLAVLIGLFLPGWPQPWAGRASMQSAGPGKPGASGPPPSVSH